MRMRIAFESVPSRSRLTSTETISTVASVDRTKILPERFRVIRLIQRDPCSLTYRFASALVSRKKTLKTVPHDLHQYILPLTVCQPLDSLEFLLPFPIILRHQARQNLSAKVPLLPLVLLLPLQT